MKSIVIASNMNRAMSMRNTPHFAKVNLAFFLPALLMGLANNTELAGRAAVEDALLSSRASIRRRTADETASVSLPST